MRAVVYDRYGGPADLRVEDVPVPEVGPGDVLVQVVAVSLNLSDWEALRGSPFYARFDGLTRPSNRTLGSDIAGVVAAVGSAVTRFRVGDPVFGDVLARKGGFAEYAIARESELVHKQAGLSFAEASCLPQSGAIAAQAIALARSGGRMLLNGAGGGTGMFVLQLARAAGISVVGVDNAHKQESMRETGAAAVIDYRAEDFTRTGPYDLIIDLVATRSIFAYRRALARGGRYLMVGGRFRTLLKMVTVGPLLGLLSGARLGVLFVQQGPRGFAPTLDACVRGDVAVHIDRTFTLEEVPEALAYLGAGRALGKLVVEVRSEAV